MAASRYDISKWFDHGRSQKATHMIVVCDTYDHADYPVYAEGNSDAVNKHKDYSARIMQRVMEVYDLREPKEPQLNEPRAMHLPEAQP